MERRVGGAQRLEGRRASGRPKARVLGNKLHAMQMHKSKARHVLSFPWRGKL